MAPSDRRYLASHEWAKREEDGTILVGITDFAIQHLSDLVFLDLPSTGSKVEQGAPFGEIESVKAVSELLSPVGGEVVEVNEDLADDLDTLASSPFEKGWMIRVRPEGDGGWDSLLEASAYEKAAAEERH